MKLREKYLQRLGVILAYMCILGLLGSGLVGKALSNPEVVSFLFYLETGKVVKPPPPSKPEETQPPPTQTEETQPPPEEIWEQPVFSAEDEALVTVNNLTAAAIDLKELLVKPLKWDLTAEEPTVLILHTHATESYTKTEDYVESSDYRTLDENYNMLSIGSRVEQLLKEAGISVVHDRALHDYPSYNGSYVEAREAIRGYLEQYPTIQVVLDLHRDAVATQAGTQMGYTTPYGDRQAAQLMFVVGTDTGGLNHEKWQENLAVAVKMQAQMEKHCPGICRPLSLRAQRFNQDLSMGAMLIEMGAAGNTRQEALLSAEILSKALIDLSQGAKAGSTS